ncbi:hypothetical protein [Enterococcus avium]|nr:hypothetical protein [Enterococcus avium]
MNSRTLFYDGYRVYLFYYNGDHDDYGDHHSRHDNLFYSDVYHYDVP